MIAILRRRGWDVHDAAETSRKGRIHSPRLLSSDDALKPSHNCDLDALGTFRNVDLHL